MNFQIKLIAQEGGQVRAVTAKEKGRDAWFILQLNPNKYGEYKNKMKSGDLDIQDYGIILKSGWGKDIPAEFKNYLNS